MSGRPAPWLVLPAPGLLAAEAAAPDLTAARAFERTRNDPGLTARTAAPLTATGQWPEPPRPVERPVRFERFDQSR